MRGPGFSMVEGTAILPEGRISPEDTGIWNDKQTAAWAEIVIFAHSQNQKIGMQLEHAGRKASVMAPWLPTKSAAYEEQGGWPDDVIGASSLPHGPGFHTPRALTKDGIESMKQAYVDAAKRSLQAGFDVIEIHTAHGYLLHEFLSPISNKRTDEYGGSFENRTRLLIEIIDLVRAVIPQDMPLFLRYTL